MKKIIFMLMTFTLLSGCASLNKSLRALFGKVEPQVVAEKKSDPSARFSKQDNLKDSTARKYRMTKERMEEEAGLASNSGSLWMMEGQNAYLFAPNTTRLIGDMLNVKLEGSPQKQLQTKVHVIARLLDKIDHPDTLLGRGPASQASGEKPAGDKAAQPPAAGTPGAKPDPNGAAAAAANGQQPPTEEAAPKADSKFDVQTIPTRITEILKDGSYRVKGLQSFMIGKREYKAIVTGIVRPEDFNDDGINASKLLDSQFDIVNTKKAATL